MSTDAPREHLSHFVGHSAQTRPDHPAVEDEAGRVQSYAELDRQADRLCARLSRWGVGRGDRAGLFLPKSVEAVAAIHGILRAGAAYVPVDSTAPPSRGGGIFADGGVKVVVTTAALAEPLRAAWPGSGPLPRLILVNATDTDFKACGDTTWEDIQADDAPTPLPPPRDPEDTAYILYTSGSTGTPKGVVLTHANAFCFLNWCDGALGPRGDDRFSSHAPFHFDLSVFDLFVSARHGGTLVLIGEALAKDPARLGGFVSRRRISVWYSAPSVLALMATHGGLENVGYVAPRLALFAGEVFPILPLKRLRNLWPNTTLWNLYGPTETNVCTAEPIPATIPADREEPYPIGRACPPLLARVVDETGTDVPNGTVGELLIAGSGVMRGYFGRPDLTAAAFLDGPDGVPWYRTGDLVADDGSGGFAFHGRRDRMVKKRGYRIELGEIESALHRSDDVERAAVLASSDESGVAISAFVALKPGRRGSIIAMKRHCTSHLPHYMIPDAIAFLPNLPTTSTDKVDYQGLRRLAADGRKP